MDLGVSVVDNALAEQEDDGVDTECADAGDGGVVEAVARVAVEVADRVLLARVVDGVVSNLVGGAVGVAGLVSETIEVVVLAECTKEREGNACEIVLLLILQRRLSL